MFFIAHWGYFCVVKINQEIHVYLLACDEKNVVVAQYETQIYDKSKKFLIIISLYGNIEIFLFIEVYMEYLLVALVYWTGWFRMPHKPHFDMKIIVKCNFYQLLYLPNLFE